MYTDLSVGVSAPVVREMDKGFDALERLNVVGSRASADDFEALASVSRAVHCLEKLVLWSEEQLFDKGEYELWLCRKIEWTSDFRTLIEEGFGEEYEEFIRNATAAGRALVEGNPVDPDAFDALGQICLELSEAIWDHFIMLHYFAAEEA